MSRFNFASLAEATTINVTDLPIGTVIDDVEVAGWGWWPTTLVIVALAVVLWAVRGSRRE